MFNTDGMPEDVAVKTLKGWLTAHGSSHILYVHTHSYAIGQVYDCMYIMLCIIKQLN